MPTGRTGQVTTSIGVTPDITPDTWAGALQAAHLQFPTRNAVLTPDGWRTYDNVLETAGKIAAWLEANGIDAGERIVLVLDNRWEMVIIERALALWGRVRVALSPRLHQEEIDYVIEDCDAALVICEAGIASALMSRIPIVVPAADGTDFTTLDELLACDLPVPPLPAVSAQDLASLMYTSGTTGRPKGAMNSQGSWLAMARNTLELLPPIGTQDVLLHAAPMSHFSGSVASAFAAYGGAIATIPRFDPLTLVEEANRLGATCIPLVPTMIGDLVAQNRSGSFRTLRSMPYGGSSISPDMLIQARSMFGDILLQMYGMSEALIPVASLSIADHADAAPSDPRLRSAGRPFAGIDLRLSDMSEGVGEIQVRGANVMSAYWRRPAETREVLSEDGWYASGDLGRIDEQGYLEIVGRKRDLLISGGFNIYPAEIERVISQLPDVAEVAVVGAPHSRWGETTVAVIARRAGRTVTPETVVEHCCRHLASYKKPSRVVFVEVLPKTSTGKINKAAIRGLIADRPETPSFHPAQQTEQDSP